jgi:murein DD-endopeptidase MepM/ murein hydrolase activator NlpD
MGDHRAPKRAPRRASRNAASVTPKTSSSTSAPSSAPGRRIAAKPAKPARERKPLVVRDAAPSTRTPRAAQAPGRRVSSRHSGSRGKLFRALPSLPALAGVAALAIAMGGALQAPTQLVSHDRGILQANALSGSTAASSSDLLSHRNGISRDSRRDALGDSTDAQLLAAAEQQARQRNAQLAKFASQVEQQSKKMALNLWVAPTDPIVLTARFGDYGLWSGYHTGLDFNGNTGDPIYAITGGVITSASYDGSYGNKTVETLPDGTELWYCHQNQFNVSVGDVVKPGQLIGYIGSTGHVTGSHLHVEVRPGGGDPVDPYPAFELHGVDLPP